MSEPSLPKNNWYWENRNRKLAYQKKYRQNHLNEIRQKSMEYRAKIKLEVFKHYSKGKLHCEICGEHELSKLTLDHINNDGSNHRKANNYSLGTQTWIWAKQHGFPPIFQVLCHECNFLKSLPERKVLLHAQIISRKHEGELL